MYETRNRLRDPALINVHPRRNCANCKPAAQIRRKIIYSRTMCITTGLHARGLESHRETRTSNMNPTSDSPSPDPFITPYLRIPRPMTFTSPPLVGNVFETIRAPIPFHVLKIPPPLPPPTPPLWVRFMLASSSPSNKSLDSASPHSFDSAFPSPPRRHDTAAAVAAAARPQLGSVARKATALAELQSRALPSCAGGWGLHSRCSFFEKELQLRQWRRRIWTEWVPGWFRRCGDGHLMWTR